MIPISKLYYLCPSIQFLLITWQVNFKYFMRTSEVNYKFYLTFYYLYISRGKLWVSEKTDRKEERI